MAKENFREKIKRFFCSHKWKLVESSSATVHFWGSSMFLLKNIKRECSRCGKVKITRIRKLLKE